LPDVVVTEGEKNRKKAVKFGESRRLWAVKVI